MNTKLILIATAAVAAGSASAAELPTEFTSPCAAGAGPEAALASDNQWWEANNADKAGGPVTMLNGPNSLALHDSFVGSLGAAITNDFESLATCGSLNCNDGDVLQFGTLSQATISSSGGSQSRNRIFTSGFANGFRPTSGTAAYALQQGSVTFTFDPPVPALGMYIADSLESSQLTVTCANGATEILTASPASACTGTSCNPLLFIGTIRSANDPGDYCESVTISSPGSRDGIMIDDLIVGKCSEDLAGDECNCFEIDCGCEDIANGPASSDDKKCVKLAFADPADEDSLQCEPRSINCE